MSRKTPENWIGRWVCIPCGIDESKSFPTKESAEQWAKAEETDHTPSGIHVRVAKAYDYLFKI